MGQRDRKVHVTETQGRWTVFRRAAQQMLRAKDLDDICSVGEWPNGR